MTKRKAVKKRKPSEVERCERILKEARKAARAVMAECKAGAP